MNPSRSSWILHWLFLHQVPRRLFPAASRCTFRSVLLLLLLRLPRTLEYNLWWKSRRSDGTELHTTMAFDRVCQTCSPLFCALVFFTPVDNVLRMFSTYFDNVSFLGFVKSSLGHSSSESSSSKGLRRVKKTVCLLSFSMCP